MGLLKRSGLQVALFGSIPGRTANKTVTRAEVHVMLNEFATASSHIGRRAIVIGAGVSGLSAADGLANHFEEVVVLERDELPDGATPRPGPPQGKKAHGVLGRDI